MKRVDRRVTSSVSVNIINYDVSTYGSKLLFSFFTHTTWMQATLNSAYSWSQQVCTHHICLHCIISCPSGVQCTWPCWLSHGLKPEPLFCLVSLMLIHTHKQAFHYVLNELTLMPSPFLDFFFFLSMFYLIVGYVIKRVHSWFSSAKLNVNTLMCKIGEVPLEYS